MDSLRNYSNYYEILGRDINWTDILLWLQKAGMYAEINSHEELSVNTNEGVEHIEIALNLPLHLQSEEVWEFLAGLLTNKNN